MISAASKKNLKFDAAKRVSMTDLDDLHYQFIEY